MSTPRQGRKTEARHKREKWWIGIASALAGAVVTSCIVFLATAIRSTDSASGVSAPTTTVHVVCPETLGVVFDMQGIPTILRTSCGSDFVVSPVIAGTYDLNRIASLMIDDMRTGTATVKGNRIDIDMGSKRDPNAWNDALVRAINA